ncbi:hypothetical protein [Streptomyces sp. NPDC086766]|uniref:hypothetical protein n=1 Tax=Streptomyces sp. NPDC086766 TaxID=3365754 RepID=UPI003823BC29
MTQSGQGEEPSAQPAREGIVLPSDGSEPLLPGMTGAPAARPPAQPSGQNAAPAGGQAWGQPWGPGDQQPAPQPGQGWQAPAGQPWSTPGHDPYQQQPQAHWGAQGPDTSGAQESPSGAPAYPGAGPLPPEGAPAPHHDMRGSAPSAYGTPPGPMPSAGADPYGSAAGQPLPPAVPGHGIPGAADEGATQYLPPVSSAPADEGATQFLPPVAQGGLPPEVSGDQATRFLGRLPQDGSGPPPYAAPGGGSDAEATQYIAPVDAGAGGAPPYGAGPGGDGGRQTPAEFDNLFRSDAGGGAPATQQLPRFQETPAGHPHDRPAYAPPGRGDRGDRGGDGGRGGGTRSRVPVIAAVGIGIAVLGIGAGALLSGGGDGGDQTGGDDKNVSATAPATDGSAAADPARQQAVELDKLLSDSGSSRASVISAVADVKNCGDLGGAASDLRAAAKQRNELVTRLQQLSVDRLPRHGELTAALTGAWRASASADAHYAAWADQVGGRKGCKKGHARTTNETQAGNRQSGVASAQKVKAAQLWNVIAQKYGLTQRQPTQL